jgi:hypothetical protein
MAAQGAIKMVFATAAILISTTFHPGYLNLPERSEQAMEGSEFVRQVSTLGRADREMAVVREVLSGNVPSFSRSMRMLTISDTLNGQSHELKIFVACDYLAIGSDRDYVYMPMTPGTAQLLADTLNCTLPTKKIVDIIYGQAEIKLSPQPIPPSDSMTTVPVFSQHTDSIKQQILQKDLIRSPDDLWAGHKKDVIISNEIYSSMNTSKKVVIYGWHMDLNLPIQPVFSGHGESYADYSHGVRLISKSALLDGESMALDHLLQDPVLCGLISDEGRIGEPSYPKK